MVKLPINNKRFLYSRVLAVAMLMTALCDSSELFAQSENTGNLFIGFEGGMQITGITNPGYPVAPESRVNPVAGVYAIYDIGWPVMFKAGIYYDPRSYNTSYQSAFLRLNDSSSFTGYNSYYKYDIDNKIRYLTVPVSFVYQKGEGKFKIFVEAGIYYSLYVGNRVQGSTDVYIDEKDLAGFDDPALTAGHHPQTVNQSPGDFFNTYDFGMNLRLGAVYQITPAMALELNPGFSYGFANVFENPDYSSKWNNIFKIHLGILYNLHSENKKIF